MKLLLSDALPAAERRSIFMQYDRNCNGQMDVQEFVHTMDTVFDKIPSKPILRSVFRKAAGHNMMDADEFAAALKMLRQLELSAEHRRGNDGRTTAKQRVMQGYFVVNFLAFVGFVMLTLANDTSQREVSGGGDFTIVGLLISGVSLAVFLYCGLFLPIQKMWVQKLATWWRARREGRFQPRRADGKHGQNGNKSGGRRGRARSRDIEMGAAVIEYEPEEDELEADGEDEAPGAPALMDEAPPPPGQSYRRKRFDSYDPAEDAVPAFDGAQLEDADDGEEGGGGGTLPGQTLDVLAIRDGAAGHSPGYENPAENGYKADRYGAASAMYAGAATSGGYRATAGFNPMSTKRPVGR